MAKPRRAPACSTGPAAVPGIAVVFGVLACMLLVAPGAARSAPAPDSAAGMARVAPQPPAGLTGDDEPNDAGRALDLKWQLSPDDSLGHHKVLQYYIERATDPAGPWTIVDSVLARTMAYVDQSVRRNTDYFYRVSAVGPGGITPARSVTGPLRATSSWFNDRRYSVLVGSILFFGFVLFFMSIAQSGRKPFVRRIPGIDAIEEAIGRATEMGRSVLYIPGILDIDDIQTVAGLVILENVAKITARYETPITVPVSYPIPFTIAEEMVKAGYLNAGKPELYDPNAVRFISPEQFAYVAAVTGIMLRDRPAAHIFMGAFYAESLLLAETGFETGAIQVAGTANVAQLPFFVVACDYTLIGEELFAASAYLSGDPKLVGGLKGADLMKVLIISAVLIGCVLETLGIHGFTRWMETQ